MSIFDQLVISLALTIAQVLVVFAVGLLAYGIAQLLLLERFRLPLAIGVATGALGLFAGYHYFATELISPDFWKYLWVHFLFYATLGGGTTVFLQWLFQTQMIESPKKEPETKEE